MIYTVRVKATRRNLGDFEAPTPTEALAAMLVSRGVSSGSGDLLARVLDGLEAVPVARDFADTLAALGSKAHAEVSGALAGLEFAAREEAERRRFTLEIDGEPVDVIEIPSWDPPSYAPDHVWVRRLDGEGPAVNVAPGLLEPADLQGGPPITAGDL